MAGGQSPRQKMINLMYLVFIAMLALNMSKEVLSAFGLMNEKLVQSNEAATQRNVAFMSGLDEKVEEQPAKYKPLKAQADQIDKLSNDFNGYLTNLKSKMTEGIEDTKDYEVMDKGDFLDNYFFIGEKLRPEGQEFLDQIATFRDGVAGILASNPDMASIREDVLSKFGTEPVENRDGKKVDWLNYNFEGFPLVASLTKMTQLQADVKTTESEVLSSMLAGKLRVEASLTNFEAIVVPDKTAFFSGENFTGKIILGKKDKTLTADKVVVNGVELDKSAMQSGQTNLSFPAGAVGEREITGEFQFKEGDSVISIPVISKYAVVPKPNSATISADKMNVVYRGVANPMTISFAGVSDNNVNASAAGLTRKAGSNYMMNPGSGREVKINVTGKLSTGETVSDSKTFRIKDLPKPSGMVRGESGSLKMSRRAVEISTVSAEFENFDFELTPRVGSFKLKVSGQPTVTISGTKLNGAGVNALKKARRGDLIQIFDIDASVPGVKLKGTAPVTIELAD